MPADTLAKVEVPPQQKGTGRWVAATLAAAAVLLLLTASLNAVVNPRAEFPTRTLPPLVGDEPATKRLAFHQLDGAPDRLVLGSSRAAVLPPGNATADGFNFGMSAGDVADARFAYRYVQNHGRAAHVVLVLDSYTFAEPFDGSAVRRSEAHRALAGGGLDLADYAGLAVHSLDASYVEDSVRSLRLAATDSYPTPARTVAPDGVRVSTRLDREIADGTFDAARTLERNWRTIDALHAEGAMDPSTAPFLQGFVAEMAADGVTVQLVLLPFHPVAYGRLAGRPEFVSIQEAVLEAALATCGAQVRVHDLSSPDALGLTGDDFYDGWHLRPAAARAVAASLETAQDLCRP